MIEKSQPDVVNVKDQKSRLFRELDELLLETFHTTTVIIDEQKLVNGEEGCLCNMDLEYIEDGAKQGLIDESLMTAEDKEQVRKEITNILQIINN